MAQSLTVPHGQYPPFAVVTDTDHTAWIIIATALGLSCLLLFTAVRVFVRYTSSPLFGFDDAFLTASTILAIVQSSIMLGASSLGLGRSIEILQPGVLPRIQQMYYASIILFIVALGLSKCSVASFLLRLTPMKRHTRAFNGVLAFIGAWTIGSTFALALQCNLTHPWILVGELCSGALLRWQVICALDIVTEICLVAMAVDLVRNLSTSMSKKAIVVFAFGFRLPLIIAIAMRLVTLDEAGLTTDPTLRQDLFIVWTQTELNYSIIAATIPTLRPFMTGLATYYGALGQGMYGPGSDKQPEPSYPMSNLNPTAKSNNMNASFQRSATESISAFEATPHAYSYGISAKQQRADGRASHKDQQVLGKWRDSANGTKESVETQTTRQDVYRYATSAGSNDSQRMIIRKDIAWTVEHVAE